MGSGIIPRWSQNAGYLLATQILHGGEVRLNCTIHCGRGGIDARSARPARAP